MSAVHHPLRLTGVIQEYAWGGFDFLAQLTGRVRNDAAPWAELWLGTHPKGVASTPHGRLNDLIAAAPAEVLSPTIAEQYDNRLPFLFKVLDVRQMLSIQTHPTKAAAESGFAREEAAGISPTAPDRNYRDRNHKPELGVALTDFYLLHGFKAEAAIRESILAEPSWAELLPLLAGQGLAGLYRTVMEAPQSRVNSWLQPLADRLAAQRGLQKDRADFWAKRAFQQYSKDGDHDRGIFSIYWFNLVHLRPGQGIFQRAGIPHAYLEGSCVELMANSDNVLRGGLTGKHIDLAELMKQLDFSSVVPEILERQPRGAIWQEYSVPVPDFKLLYAEITAGKSARVAEGPAILLIMEGELRIAGTIFMRGEAAWLPYGHQARMESIKNSQLYLARVGNGFS